MYIHKHIYYLYIYKIINNQLILFSSAFLFAGKQTAN